MEPIMGDPEAHEALAGACGPEPVPRVSVPGLKRGPSALPPTLRESNQKIQKNAGSYRDGDGVDAIPSAREAVVSGVDVEESGVVLLCFGPVDEVVTLGEGDVLDSAAGVLRVVDDVAPRGVEVRRAPHRARSFPPAVLEPSKRGRKTHKHGREKGVARA